MKITCNVEVDAKNFNSFEAMVRKFSKLVKNSGIIDESIKKRYFKSKSVKRAEAKRKKDYLVTNKK